MLTVLAVMALTVPVTSLAQSDPIPERFAATASHVDVPGNDIESIFDVTLQRCHAACLANGDCAAFTFNQRNGSCFLKSAAAATQGYQDAVSGFVTQQSPEALERAREVGAALDFLDEYDLMLARQQADAMAESYQAERESEAYWLGILGRLEPGQVVTPPARP